MRVSLCVICGNEENNIEKCLDSFAGAFDELSLTRAIGSLAPDRTLELAEKWCKANGKDYVGAIYENAPGPALEHVDNFAAARNKSFEGGTGDWLFWADCDDFIDDAASLRAALEAATVDLIRFPYDVVGTNKRPMRERAIRRNIYGGLNRWQFAIHENLRVEPGTKMADMDAPIWIHQPKLVGTVNRKRNKMILARTLANSAANYFYLHQEWFCEGNKRNAEKFGTLALAFPDLDPSFRYEANLNLCRLASDSDEALRYAFAAHSVFPWCREALAMACLTYIDRNDVERALFFAERLDETPVPTRGRQPWTHEPKWYGWAGNDLLARCLRLDGRKTEAEAVERREGDPIIALIHATRGRPAQAGACRNQWLNMAADPGRVEHIFSVDSDDAPTVKFVRQFKHTVSESKSCVAAWNAGVMATTAPLLVQLSDDFLPAPGWDARLLNEIDQAGKTLEDPLAVAVGDGNRKDDLLCMAILTRARWRDQGCEMFSEEYESVFSDNEFSHRAWRDGIVIDARERITFPHHHPAFQSAPMDATYAHTNDKNRYKRGAETFKRRNPDAFPCENS